MAKFTIQPHGRLQEWIAHEKGYFRDAGLDYEFRGGLSAQRKKQVGQARLACGRGWTACTGDRFARPRRQAAASSRLGRR